MLEDPAKLVHASLAARNFLIRALGRLNCSRWHPPRVLSGLHHTPQNKAQKNSGEDYWRLGFHLVNFKPADRVNSDGARWTTHGKPSISAITADFLQTTDMNFLTLSFYNTCSAPSYSSPRLHEVPINNLPKGDMLNLPQLGRT